MPTSILREGGTLAGVIRSKFNQAVSSDKSYIALLAWMCRSEMMKMNRYLGYLLITVLTVLPILSSACTAPVEDAEDRITEEAARELAKQFVQNSPTFAFDGIEESLELVETLYPDIENSWTFVFHFESRHAGYADRTGQMLAQVITSHDAVVTVEQGKVKSAFLDEKWDMVNQKMLNN